MAMDKIERDIKLIKLIKNIFLHRSPVDDVNKPKSHGKLLLATFLCDDIVYEDGSTDTLVFVWIHLYVFN